MEYKRLSNAGGEDSSWANDTLQKKNEQSMDRSKIPFIILIYMSKKQKNLRKQRIQ
jgi:hypothetical protein